MQPAMQGSAAVSGPENHCARLWGVYAEEQNLEVYAAWYMAQVVAEGAPAVQPLPPMPAEPVLTPRDEELGCED